jgi:anhydro-N-acetylmuramic acid kinase
MIIDALAQRFAGRPYDDGGSLASRGKIDETLLHRLMDDPYFALSPPKSTGREVYGAPYVQRLIEMAEHLSPEDLIATATAFTAWSIADSYKRFVMPRHGLDRVVVSGGGARNKTLLSYLESYLDREIVTGEAYGVPDQGREAMAFAFLAHESLNRRPSNFPLATGARERTILGTITLQEPVQI